MMIEGVEKESGLSGREKESYESVYRGDVRVLGMIVESPMGTQAFLLILGVSLYVWLGYLV